MRDFHLGSEECRGCLDCKYCNAHALTAAAAAGDHHGVAEASRWCAYFTSMLTSLVHSGIPNDLCHKSDCCNDNMEQDTAAGTGVPALVYTSWRLFAVLDCHADQRHCLPRLLYLSFSSCRLRRRQQAPQLQRPWSSCRAATVALWGAWMPLQLKVGRGLAVARRVLLTLVLHLELGLGCMFACNPFTLPEACTQTVHRWLGL